MSVVVRQRRRAVEVFSWESVAAQTVRVYKQAIARTATVDDSSPAVSELC